MTLRTRTRLTAIGSGKGGTGKTVLAYVQLICLIVRRVLTSLSSVVIETINTTLTSPSIGVAFLYCVYAERGDQTADQLLCSVIQQLVRAQNFILGDIRELYHKHHRSNIRPDLAEISKTLESVASLFSRVYIVVDALDECNNSNKTRDSLLSCLWKLDVHVQLLFTSRPLDETIPKAVQFQVTAQETDMCKYLSGQIQKEPGLAKLCAKHQGLQEEVLDKIITKVGGM